MFNFHDYLRNVVAHNRLAKAHGFHFDTCTGIEGVEGILAEFSTQANFVLSDDITSGETFENSGSFFRRRTFTVFVLSRHEFMDEIGRDVSIDICRELSRQLQSRFLRDRWNYLTDSVDLKVANMPSTEIAQFFANGLTGLYFMISIDEPLNLCYDDDEWDD